jgi:deoxyribonuclease-4
MKIRFGPAGIPLSCKGRTLKDGIRDVAHLNLNAMEIQLIRAVGSNIDNLKDIGKIADEFDVKLSVHAPYYMDFAGNKETIARSIENLKWSGVLANEMKAEVVNTHVALYGNNSKKGTLEKVVENVRLVRDWYKKQKIKSLIGLETSGHQKVFGSVDEILQVCKRISNTIPVVNFAHVHAREYGSLKKKDDFQDIFDKIQKVTRSKSFYCHFSGVEHDNGNKKRCTPIKKGDMRFDPLADCILDNKDYKIVIISGSPLLEHDAQYMKVILERVKTKRELKAQRKNNKKDEK